MLEPIIEIKDLNVFFGKENTTHALKDVNIQLYPSHITALIGTSGSGKSVSSLALMGLLPKQAKVSGSILYKKNKDLLSLSEKEWTHYRGKKISMIFQEPMSALNPLMTCGEQILETYVKHHPNSSSYDAKQKVIEWLYKVQLPNPEEIYHKYPHQISGGQKQRIVIAIAMINEPELIIADEPTTALDVIVQKEIIELLKSLQQVYNTSILFITHDLLLAQSIADTIIEMKKGRIVERTLTHEKVEPKQTTVELKNDFIQIKNLFVSYVENRKKFLAVNDVSLSIPKGKTIGLIGGSGCGKTTISKAILGLIKAESGTILYKNTDLTTLRNHEWKQYRKYIQIVFQDPFAALNPRMKIGVALDEGLKIHTNYSTKERKEKIIQMLEKVELQASDYEKYPHEFSGGQRQRICIARALIVEPEFVICDESVAALDVVIQKQILELLVRLQEELHLTYLFITHDINVVKKICDYVYVMEKGKIVEEGVPLHIISEAKHPYTQALIDAVPQ